MKAGGHVKSPAAQGVRSVITARVHLVEAHFGLDNTIRGLVSAKQWQDCSV
jgi:hypothetical protein